VLDFFYFLATVQILAGLYLIGEGLRWVGYVRRRMLSHAGFYAPRVAVLCPCKDLEPGLEQNLHALCEFDYSNYEVFFILATASDPACSSLHRVAESSKIKAHVVIAGAPEACGEKVHNLLAGIEQLPPDFDALVFADSDGRPGRHWLAHLVAPLNDPRLGAATTMRWYLPNRTNFPTALLAAWNAPIVTLLGEHNRNFCWGGGTAIRRSVFEKANVAAEWEGSVSDDFSMTRALRRAGRPILFVPECLTLSFPATDFNGLLEFTNRQMLITRIYAPKLWATAAATHLVYCLTILLGGLLFLVNVFAGHPAFHLAVLTFLPMVLAAIRGALRIAGVSEALPAWRAQIVEQGWIWTALAVIVPFLYLVNFATSVATRTIRWRGIRYELISPSQTKILFR
jgi:ceramide glucosyltransferase